MLNTAERSARRSTIATKCDRKVSCFKEDIFGGTCSVSVGQLAGLSPIYHNSQHEDTHLYLSNFKTTLPISVMIPSHTTV